LAVVLGVWWLVELVEGVRLPAHALVRTSIILLLAALGLQVLAGAACPVPLTLEEHVLGEEVALLLQGRGWIGPVSMRSDRENGELAKVVILHIEVHRCWRI